MENRLLFIKMKSDLVFQSGLNQTGDITDIMLFVSAACCVNFDP